MAQSQTEAEELAARGGQLARVGDFKRATSLLESAMGSLRGVRSTMASRAYGDLGSLYAIGGRRFESILVWRRALDIARERSLGHLVLRHLANLSGAYAALALWEDLRAQQTECEAALAALPQAEQLRSAVPFLWPRVYLALQDGDGDALRTLFGDVQTAYAGHADPSTIAISLAMKADIQREDGDAQKALATLAAAERLAGLPPLDRIYVVCRTIEHLTALGREADAAARAPEVLTEIEALGPDELLGDLSIDQVIDLGRLLADSPAGADEARRAFAVAASIARGRIGALDRAAERTPALCELAACDEAWIASLRAAYRRHEEELLQH